MSEIHPGFQSLIDALKRDEDRFTGYVPVGWMQGRTAYGGVSTAMALAVAKARFPGLAPLRSLQMGFVGPVGEQPVFSPSVLRQGRNVTVVGVNVESGGRLCGRLTLFFGASRKSALSETLTAPDAPEPETVEPFTPPAMRRFVPVFFLRFDTRLIEGHRPMTGAKDGYMRLWSRHEDPASRDGILSFIALADALPPAAAPKLTTFGPVSSMNWQLNILTPELATRDGWWHVETRLSAGQDGYSAQIMRYWNTDGTLIAEGTQSVALFV
ncbi:MAG: thioesterase family protein [Hyphomonadaceae bacterium]|nr:thioesterase family protein [Hyphomonadaceae bacterium]MBC6412184.1 thioesterase family protein [Hyphomonadaceae bacterium]